VALPLLPLPFNPSGALRTRIGKTALAVGMASAAFLLAYGIWAALVWRENYGVVLLFSGLCYATAVYLISRTARRVVDRRRRQAPRPGEPERRTR
jgi:hypothetical protein